MLPRTFVINLDRRQDRMDKLFMPIPYERFSATDGKQFKEVPVKMQGHIGCWDSHRRILEKIKEEGISMALVMEDDAECTDDFERKLSFYMTQLPEDWDLFYLGGWNVAEPFKKHSENLNVAERVLTTHAYLVRDKFIPILLDAINNRKFKIDVVFASVLDRGKCFIATPVLAWQRSGYSDITNSVNSNKHLK